MTQLIEKRFGNIAVELGLITYEQLLRAMNIQLAEEIGQEKHRLLGLILVELGALTMAQVDQVLEALADWRRTSPV